MQNAGFKHLTESIINYNVTIMDITFSEKNASDLRLDLFKKMEANINRINLKNAPKNKVNISEDVVDFFSKEKKKPMDGPGKLKGNLLEGLFKPKVLSDNELISQLESEITFQENTIKKNGIKIIELKDLLQINESASEEAISSSSQDVATVEPGKYPLSEKIARLEGIKKTHVETINKQKIEIADLQTRVDIKTLNAQIETNQKEILENQSDIKTLQDELGLASNSIDEQKNSLVSKTTNKFPVENTSITQLKAKLIETERMLLAQNKVLVTLQKKKIQALLGPVDKSFSEISSDTLNNLRGIDLNRSHEQVAGRGGLEIASADDTAIHMAVRFALLLSIIKSISSGLTNSNASEKNNSSFSMDCMHAVAHTTSAKSSTDKRVGKNNHTNGVKLFYKLATLGAPIAMYLISDQLFNYPMTGVMGLGEQKSQLFNSSLTELTHLSTSPRDLSPLSWSGLFVNDVTPQPTMASFSYFPETMLSQLENAVTYQNDVMSQPGSSYVLLGQNKEGYLSKMVIDPALVGELTPNMRLSIHQWLNQLVLPPLVIPASEHEASFLLQDSRPASELPSILDDLLKLDNPSVHQKAISSNVNVSPVATAVVLLAAAMLGMKASKKTNKKSAAEESARVEDEETEEMLEDDTQEVIPQDVISDETVFEVMGGATAPVPNMLKKKHHSSASSSEKLTIYAYPQIKSAEKHCAEYSVDKVLLQAEVNPLSIKHHFPETSLNEEQLNQLKSKEGLDVTSPAGLNYSFSLETGIPVARLKKEYLFQNEDENIKNQRRAMAVINMIDNVLAHSSVVNIKTRDPLLANIARDYVNHLNETCGFNITFYDLNLPAEKDTIQNEHEAIFDQLKTKLLSQDNLKSAAWYMQAKKPSKNVSNVTTEFKGEIKQRHHHHGSTPNPFNRSS